MGCAPGAWRLSCAPCRDAVDLQSDGWCSERLFLHADAARLSFFVRLRLLFFRSCSLDGVVRAPSTTHPSRTPCRIGRSCLLTRPPSPSSPPGGASSPPSGPAPCHRCSSPPSLLVRPRPGAGAAASPSVRPEVHLCSCLILLCCHLFIFSANF